MSKLYMKNSDGKPSASLTMAMVSFVLVTAWLVFWVVGTAFGLHHIPAFDATVAMGYMTPLLGLYFGRRWSEGGAIESGASQSSSADSSESSEVSESDSSEETTEEETEEVASSTAEEPATPEPAPTNKKRGRRS